MTNREEPVMTGVLIVGKSSDGWCPIVHLEAEVAGLRAGCRRYCWRAAGDGGRWVVVVVRSLVMGSIQE